jgi:hypothetical protein
VHVVVLDQAFAEEEMSAAAKGVESTGRSSPLGAMVVPGGVNFSVFSPAILNLDLASISGLNLQLLSHKVTRQK